LGMEERRETGKEGFGKGHKRRGMEGGWVGRREMERCLAAARRSCC
jgi:hypothetical protein